MVKEVTDKRRSEVALVREAARRARKQRTITEIRSLARTKTVEAVNTLVGIMNDENAPAHARVSAATAILDRGWGKPLQPLASEDGKPLEFVHRIERVIVHPGDNLMIDARTGEAVQSAPISILGSVNVANALDNSNESEWTEESA